MGAGEVEAYGRGEIELEPVPETTNRKVIYQAFPSGNAYTLGSIARFLRWTKPNDGQAITACREAFDAYHE
jgi:hypothetical protein